MNNIYLKFSAKQLIKIILKNRKRNYDSSKHSVLFKNLEKTLCPNGFLKTQRNQKLIKTNSFRVHSLTFWHNKPSTSSNPIRKLIFFWKSKTLLRLSISLIRIPTLSSHPQLYFYRKSVLIGLTNAQGLSSYQKPEGGATGIVN